MYMIYQSYWSGNEKIPRGTSDDNRPITFTHFLSYQIPIEGTIEEGVYYREILYYIVDTHTMYADVNLSIKLTLTKPPRLTEPCSVYDYITLITISIDIAVLLFS